MIIRERREGEPVVLIRRAAAQDRSLSLRARGLLTYAMSKPTDWRFSSDRIADEASEGRDAIRNAANELAAQGYVRWVLVRGADGRVSGREWVVSDRPDLVRRATGFQAPGNQALGDRPAADQAAADQAAVSQAQHRERELERETPPPTPAAPPVGSDGAQLLVVVVAALQSKSAPVPGRAGLGRECARLAALGWTPQALDAAVRGHDWSGARAGAVITWLRAYQEPPTAAPERPVRRPDHCGTCDPISRLLMTDEGRPRRGHPCPTCSAPVEQAS